MTDSARGSRTLARRAALQGIYQWQATGQQAEEIIGQFEQQQSFNRIDDELFRLLLQGVINNVHELDIAIGPHADRPLPQVDPIERAVLRMAAFELIHCGEVPWRVVIDESIELARVFGAEQGHRFVNGVLDKLAHIVRTEDHAG